MLSSTTAYREFLFIGIRFSLRCVRGFLPHDNMTMLRLCLASLRCSAASVIPTQRKQTLATVGVRSLVSQATRTRGGVSLRLGRPTTLSRVPSAALSTLTEEELRRKMDQFNDLFVNVCNYSWRTVAGWSTSVRYDTIQSVVRQAVRSHTYRQKWHPPHNQDTHIQMDFHQQLSMKQVAVLLLALERLRCTTGQCQQCNCSGSIFCSQIVDKNMSIGSDSHGIGGQPLTCTISANLRACIST